MKHFLSNIQGVKNIVSDNGSEFINRDYKSILAQYNVNPVYVDTGEHHNHKLAIVDRFIRTLRGMISRYQTMMNTTRYITVLPQIVKNYNNTYHSTIKCKPNKPNEEVIREINLTKTMNALLEEQTYDIGDRVRYLKNPILFQKGSLAKWSNTVHTIVAKTVHSYKLDNGGVFKYYQLMPVQTVESVEKRRTRQKAKDPTREQQKKENMTKRRLKKEGVSSSTVLTTKRARVPTERFY